jgi:branched-chain amino acid transport system substrate-binding protein
MPDRRSVGVGVAMVVAVAMAGCSNGSAGPPPTSATSPSTVRPSTTAPTTVAPTTVAPTTVVPTTVAPTTTTTTVPSTLSIGVLGDLSSADGVGKDIGNGVELAVEQYNQTAGADLSQSTGAGSGSTSTTSPPGGSEVSSTSTPGSARAHPSHIRLLRFDTRGSVQLAEAMVQRAIGQQVVAVVGPTSTDESAAADPLMEQAGIVNLTPSADGDSLSTNGWQFWHRLIADQSNQAAAAAAFLSRTIESSSVAVVNDGTAASISMASAVASDLSADGVPVLDQPVDVHGYEDPAVAAKIEDDGYEAVFVAGAVNEVAGLVQALRDSGSNALVVADGAADSSRLVKLAGPDAAQGAFIACGCADPSASPAGLSFVAGYRKEFGAPPGPFSVEGFEAANVVLSAIAAGQITSIGINKYLASHSFDGPTGVVAFDRDGQLIGPRVWLSQVQGDTIVNLGPLTGGS